MLCPRPFLPQYGQQFFRFFLSQGERSCAFAVFFARIPEKGILDFIAHGSIIQGFTVAWSGIIGFKCIWRLGWYLHFYPFLSLLSPESYSA